MGQQRKKVLKPSKHTIGLVVGCVLRQTNYDELQKNQSIGFKQRNLNYKQIKNSIWVFITKTVWRVAFQK
jgi:hypothetical protein